MDKKIGIVLMPGIDGTGVFFEPLIHALPPEIPLSVITYPPNTILSLEEHARFITQHFPTDNVIIVAESFSGLVGLQLLHQRPREVIGAVFSAAFALPLHRSLIHGLSLIPGMELLVGKFPVSLLGHFLFGPFFNKELEALLVRGLPYVDARCLKNRARLIASGYPFPEERFTIPCLYLEAGRDRLVPQEAASWFASHFYPFEHVRLDATHCLLQAKPMECSAAITDFIKRRLYPIL